MNKQSDQEKRRIKEALKVMRESSDIKYEIVRDVYRMDPSQIENGDSCPTMSTIFNYCHLFNRCPGWVLLLSCQVDDGKITEDEFFTIVKNWKSFQPLAEKILEVFFILSRSKI
jgi:hypothetical protein